MHRLVDLRSDTVTVPTPEMRRAMANAEVGDDVYGEDPTVNLLQERSAELLGKEAALFVPSGTMGNEIAVKVHTHPGDEVLIDEDCHIVKWELGAAAFISNVQLRTLPNQKGIVPVDEYAKRIQAGDDHVPPTRLICLENSHNAAGGVVLPLEYMREIWTLTQRHGIAVHLDGARIFNAAIALGVPARQLAACAHSVMFCLSKGLACPVGSMLCGSRAFIEEARRVRKILGGAMRQAGILAAAGLVALDTMIDRLAQDHARARRLAEAIANMPGFRVDLETVQTNMVYVQTEQPARCIVQQLETLGVHCLDVFPHTIRLVTHKDVDDEDVTRAIDAFAKVSG
ncbi:MAG: low-specificity L-threonine aldolase [Armatimonadota bacterium]|nr:low-specificity L-threonine aldolase [bacterium]MDW8320871.1 low-specificity L-threonine aldolase [Armatimonadota bacterium]